MPARHLGPTRRWRGWPWTAARSSPGFVFVAIKGTQLDGAEFIQFALRQGALAMSSVRKQGSQPRARPSDEPERAVHSGARTRARRAGLVWPRRFYGDVQPETMIGVTGTNGKTSVADFTRQIWAACGLRAAAFGTTGVVGEGFEEPLAMTTPEPIQLHALLARLAAKGCTHAAMEASSHGLAQHRVDGVRFKAAGLTNITRDHMDYHKDHDDYVGAKMRLFHNVLAPGGTAVLNVDDPAFAVGPDGLARAERAGRRAGSEEADIRILGAAYRSDGQDVTFTYAGARATRRG